MNRKALNYNGRILKMFKITKYKITTVSVLK